MYILIAFISAALASATLTLEEKYGPLPQVQLMRPKGKATTRSSDQRCRSFPLRIALVQDLTDSFSDDIVQMRTVQLGLMQSELAAKHPSSQLAVITFKDKPISPFGIVGSEQNGGYADYCVRINSNMTRMETKSASSIYADLKSNGGGDAPENAFGAMLLAAQSTQLGWNNPPTDARNLMVVVTDAPPHFEGDGDNTVGLPPFSGKCDEKDLSKQCLGEYYPSPEQVATAIASLNSYVAFLVYDAEDMNGLAGRSWLWFNRFINQTDDFITLQAKDSSNFWMRLSHIIEEMEGIECREDAPPTSLPGNSSAECKDSDDGCFYSYKHEEAGLIVKSQSPLADFQIIVNTEEATSASSRA